MRHRNKAAVTARVGWPAPAVLLGVVLSLVAVAPGGASGGVISIRGSISDEAGAPIPGQTIRLLKSRSILKLSGLTTVDQNVEEVRAGTDPHGFFEFSVTPDPNFRYYYLRFYDPQGFDAVKYRLPDDREISRKVRQGRPVQESVVLRLQSDWPKVKALIDEYGPASHCGQILRALGLPTRRAPQGADRELWEFDAAGVAYLVEGQKVLETRRLAATAQPPRQDDGSSPDHPQPAARVDEP